MYSLGKCLATAQAHAAMPATAEPPCTSDGADLGPDAAEDSATAAAAEPAAAQGQPAAPAVAEQSERSSSGISKATTSADGRLAES